MKTQFIFLSLLCCFTTANADSPEQNKSGTQNIQFEELKEACANPARYHNQVAPSNIQISCNEVKTKWVADPMAAASLPTKRIIVTSVISNKYSVSPTTVQLTSDPQAIECNQFKQVVESVESVHTASCETLQAFQGTAEEYCASNVDALRASNPEAIKVQETGKKISFCDAKVVKDQSERAR